MIMAIKPTPPCCISTRPYWLAPQEVGDTIAAALLGLEKLRQIDGAVLERDRGLQLKQFLDDVGF